MRQMGLYVHYDHSIPKLTSCGDHWRVTLALKPPSSLTIKFPKGGMKAG